ncbi:MAG: molybdopterin-guanine dinucleotide biosynthesis protein B [Deltaproteobacteria bacterium]|nr:molybdopterin-guanine dinucleotide biosynthesis protein B [Candidatus Zymogenaceae bacterium]
MIPIVSFVGWSDSGKTTYLERLIPELTGRGYRVCAVKHDVHGFEIDTPGKDSWRLKRAGAAVSVVSSPAKIAVIAETDHDLTLSEIRARFISDVDLIVSEGFKKDVQPKIEVFRKGIRDALLCTAADMLIAVAADCPVQTDVRVIDLDDVASMADFIEKAILKG